MFEKCYFRECFVFYVKVNFFGPWNEFVCRNGEGSGVLHCWICLNFGFFLLIGKAMVK